MESTPYVWLVSDKGNFEGKDGGVKDKDLMGPYQAT
jgi:hypothetical protein